MKTSIGKKLSRLALLLCCAPFCRASALADAPVLSAENDLAGNTLEF
jgi:hypothetical protein